MSFVKRHQLIFMKVSFNKVITKKWKSHIEVWVAKRHIHGDFQQNPRTIIVR